MNLNLVEKETTIKTAMGKDNTMRAKNNLLPKYLYRRSNDEAGMIARVSGGRERGYFARDKTEI